MRTDRERELEREAELFFCACSPTIYSGEGIPDYRFIHASLNPRAFNPYRAPEILEALKTGKLVEEE